MGRLVLANLTLQEEPAGVEVGASPEQIREILEDAR
jgi:hypothetical protein